MNCICRQFPQSKRIGTEKTRFGQLNALKRHTVKIYWARAAWCSRFSVNVDVTASMPEELDQPAQDLNVSRQAVIKILVRQALDQHYLARHARQPQSGA